METDSSASAWFGAESRAGGDRHHKVLGPCSPGRRSRGQAPGISPVSNLSMIIDSPRNNGVRLTFRSIEAADIV